MPVFLRPATVQDVKIIHAALVATAAKGLLLPRSLAELYNHVREFIVLENEKKQFLGCSSLSIVWEDLAEVRSLVVPEEFQCQGYGKLLVEANIEEAKKLGIVKVFALTYQDIFFDKLSFNVVNKDILPHKIWADCIHCVKFPDCDEIAMMREIK